MHAALEFWKNPLKKMRENTDQQQQQQLRRNFV
jgi:hypothetical protein